MLLEYEEVVKLLTRTALKYASRIATELSRSLARKVQTHMKQSFHYLARDWAFPVLDVNCHLCS